MKLNLTKIIITVLILAVFSIGGYFGLVNVKNIKEINNLQSQINKINSEKNKLSKEKNDLIIQVDELQKQVDDDRKTEEELLPQINESQDQVSKIDCVKTDKVSNSDTSGWLFCNDEELGISFRYPEKWGDVIKETVNTFNEGSVMPDDGTYEYLEIYFSNISSVYFAIRLATPDFKSASMWLPRLWNEFTGKEEYFVCPDPAEHWLKVLYCNQDLQSFSLPTISYYDLGRPFQGPLQTVKHFKIWNINSKYKGIAIDFDINSLNTPIPYDEVGGDSTSFQNKYEASVPDKIKKDKKVIAEIKELDTFVKSFSIKK